MFGVNRVLKSFEDAHLADPLPSYEKPSKSKIYSSSISVVSRKTDNRPLNLIAERTPMLILDYLQFKAARTIQRHWRGFWSRKYFKKRTMAAITIQKAWRGFHVRHSFGAFIEAKVQSTLIEHFNRASRRIQALYRGWFTRQTVHDMYSLRKMQLCAAEDLLVCVAFKLHHLLRTYSIPGVYSLRNTHCLSRIEKLLDSIHFRFLNSRVYSSMVYRESVIRSKRRLFHKANYFTLVPYAGPNYKGICKPQCDALLQGSKDVDRLMFRIMANYDKAQRDTQSKKLHDKVRRRKMMKYLEARSTHNHDFCSDVIASMRRWKVWDFNKFAFGKDIFRTPENLEKFLDDAFSILDNLQANCHCKISTQDDYCH